MSRFPYMPMRRYSPVGENQMARYSPVGENQMMPGQQVRRQSPFAPMPMDEAVPYFQRVSAPQMSDSYPRMSAPMMDSAPSFPDMQARANRGQSPRGPSAGYATSNPMESANLLQMGESPVDFQNRYDMRGYQRDANSRMNAESGAGVDYSHARTNEVNLLAPGQRSVLDSQAGLNTANANSTTALTAPRAGLLNAQATQATQLPADFKQREAGYLRELAQHRSEIDRLNQQLRLYQGQGAGSGKETPMSQGESDLLSADSGGNHEASLKTIRAVRSKQATTQPSGAQATPAPKPPAATPPAPTGGVTGKDGKTYYKHADGLYYTQPVGGTAPME